MAVSFLLSLQNPNQAAVPETTKEEQVRRSTIIDMLTPAFRKSESDARSRSTSLQKPPSAPAFGGGMFSTSSEAEKVANRAIQLAVAEEIPDSNKWRRLYRKVPSMPHPLALRLFDGRTSYLAHINSKPNALDLGVYGWSAGRLEHVLRYYMTLKVQDKIQVIKLARRLDSPYIKGFEFWFAVDAWELVSKTRFAPSDAVLRSWRKFGRLPSP